MMEEFVSVRNMTNTFCLFDGIILVRVNRGTGKKKG